MIREYLDRVEVRVQGVDDLRAAQKFHMAVRDRLRASCAGDLIVVVDDEPVRIGVKSEGEVVRHEPSSGALGRLNALDRIDGKRLDAWYDGLASLLADHTKVDISVEYQKQNNPGKWRYLVTSPDGCRAVARAVRERICSGEIPDRLEIQTTMVATDAVGTSVTVRGLGSPGPEAQPSGGRLLVPTVDDPDVDRFLAGFQLDTLFGPRMSKDALPIWNCRTPAARSLAEWVGVADARLVVAESLLVPSGTMDDIALDALRQRAIREESALVKTRLQDLHNAQGLFRKEALEFVKELQRLRAEVGSLLAGDLFRNVAAVALAALGARFGNAPPHAGFATALAVSIIMFVAATARAETHRREFARITAMNKQVVDLPTTMIVPDLRAWLTGFHNGSVRSFGAVYVLGIVLTALPGAVVAVAWATFTKDWAIIAGVCSALVVAVLLPTLWLVWRRPWRKLTILPAADGGAGQP